MQPEWELPDSGDWADPEALKLTRQALIQLQKEINLVVLRPIRKWGIFQPILSRKIEDLRALQVHVVDI